MTRFDVSSSGANALMELSRKLLSTYENLVNAGVVLEERINFLEERDVELYTKIIEASQCVTSLVKSDRENIIQLSNKLMLLSNKLQEILDISSIPDTATMEPMDASFTSILFSPSNSYSLLILTFLRLSRS